MDADTERKIRSLLADIEAMGARLKVGPPSQTAEITKAEGMLGFPLPDDYKTFLTTFGSIEIELVRTWFVYGVPEDEAVKKPYRDEFEMALREHAGDFEDFGDDDDAPYVPRRFVVLADEGRYANAGEGFVWDADLEHIRPTDGSRYVERSDHRGSDYSAFLIDQLEQIRARIADLASSR